MSYTTMKRHVNHTKPIFCKDKFNYKTMKKHVNHTKPIFFVKRSSM